MSASIYWKPTDNGGNHLDTLRRGASDFMEDIKLVFGDFPATLDKGDIPKLEVLAALHNKDGQSPYQDLIDALENTASIDIWASY